MAEGDIALHKQTIRRGSKSFAMASFFFSPSEKEAAWKLYSWCRFCDDEIDEAPSLESARPRLQKLFKEVKGLCASGIFSNFQMHGMSEVVTRYQIPLQYPLDLLRGMEMDVSLVHFENLEELEDYCYCVAGTVGLMMCHILGVRSDEALAHAVAMGQAMQLTNICRDLSEDRERGRLYIPRAWLRERHLNEEELFQPQHQAHLLEFQERLLQRADELYQKGYAGLKYLSLRSSWAVLIAAKIYSEIGTLIRRAPSKSLQNRTHVPKLRKFLLVCSGFNFFVPQLWWCWLGRRSLKRPEKVWGVG